VTRFSPDSPLSRDSTHFSASLGAGLRIPFNPIFRYGWRLGLCHDFEFEWRHILPLGSVGGVCRIHERGSSFIQGDLLAGVAYTF